jgi:hypothetical protein
MGAVAKMRPVLAALVGHAHAEGKCRLADRHPQAPQARYGEKVLRIEPVGWL